MAIAVVVDDLKIDRRLAGSLLEDRTEVKVAYAANGREALERMEEAVPDLVITDMQMPELDGLALVEAIRRDYPAVPVILMTAHGSEEAAAEALRKGAASYVPKKHLARDLVPTVQRLLALVGKQREQQAVLAHLRELALRFELDSDPAQIQPLVSFLRGESARVGELDETERTRVSVALDEALANAIRHGSAAAARRPDAERPGRRPAAGGPAAGPKVHLSVTLTPREHAYVVRDEGPGFDTTKLPDPRDPASLEIAAGRGMLLIRTFMDEVRHNASGNEITMVKRVGRRGA